MKSCWVCIMFSPGCSTRVYMKDTNQSPLTCGGVLMCRPILYILLTGKGWEGIAIFVSAEKRKSGENEVGRYETAATATLHMHQNQPLSWSHRYQRRSANTANVQNTCRGKRKKLPRLSADYTKQTIYLTPVRSTSSLNLTDLQLSTAVYLHVIKRSLLHSRGTNEQTLSSCEYKASDMQCFYFQPQNMHFI